MEAEKLMQQGIQAKKEGELELAEQKLTNALSAAQTEQNRLIEGWILKHLTNVKLQQGDYTLAENLAHQSLNIARELTERLLIVNALNVLGLSYYWKKKYAKAIDRYQEALLYLESSSLHNWKIWHNLGEAYYCQENYSQALEAYNKALDFAQLENHAFKLSLTLCNLGQTYYGMDNHEEAIAYLKQSLKFASDYQQRLRALNLLGRVYFSEEQWLESERIYQQILELIPPNKHHNYFISASIFLAKNQLELEKFEEATRSAYQATILADENQQLAELARALHTLGTAQFKLSNYNEALNAYERSLKIARNLRDTIQEITALLDLGNLQEVQGNYTPAISCFKQAHDLALQIENEEIARSTLKNLGQIYLSLGYHTLAIAYFQQYLQETGEEDITATNIIVYQQLGDAYHANGEYQAGIRNYQQALTLARESDDLEREIAALNNLVAGYRARQNYQGAISYEEQLIARAREIEDPHTTSNALLELIDLQLLAKDIRAIDSCQQLLTLCRETKAQPLHLALWHLGKVYSHFGNHARAIELLMKAIELVEQNHDLLAKGKILNSLGQICQQSGNLIAAEGILKRAVAVWEDLRVRLPYLEELKISFFSQQKNTYQFLQTVLVAQNKIIEALEIAELGRAKSLDDILDRQTDKQPTEQTITFIPQREDIIQIAKTHKATLVEYTQTPKAIYIWVIKPNGTILFERVSLFDSPTITKETAIQDKQSSELSLAVDKIRSITNFAEPLLRKLTAIDSSRELSTNYPQKREIELEKALKTVYHFVIEPIKKYLPENPKEKVIFIPQGYLFNVPFAALIDNSDSYLIEKHTISVAPSIQILKSIAQIKNSSPNSPTLRTNSTALIIGNPIMPELPRNTGYSLANLPAAEEEALEIAEILRVSPLIREEATKINAIDRMKTASLIHFATHGLLDYQTEKTTSEQSLSGAIALAPDSDNPAPKSDDGLLTATEIMAMSLQANLVVLSNCHGGRGEAIADGIIDLSRAFLMAGVPNIMVSLWTTPDSATSTLMAKFYGQMQYSVDKAQSLRQAMLNAIANNYNPIDWAAFTLIG